MNLKLAVRLTYTVAQILGAVAVLLAFLRGEPEWALVFVLVGIWLVLLQRP